MNGATWRGDRAVRTGSPVALALVDIDHFKKVNDAYGQEAGDKALRAVADALRSQLRPYDLAGRFGGEEFAILLPHVRWADALNVAALSDLAAGRADLLAEVVGLYEAHEGELDEPQARQAAQLARAAGGDPDAVRVDHVLAGGDPDRVA